MPPAHGDESSHTLTAVPRHLQRDYKSQIRYGVRGRHLYTRQASPLRFIDGEPTRLPLNPPFYYAKDQRSQKLHLYTITATPECQGWSLEELRLIHYQDKIGRKIPYPYPPPETTSAEVPTESHLDTECSEWKVVNGPEIPPMQGPNHSSSDTNDVPSDLGSNAEQVKSGHLIEETHQSFSNEVEEPSLDVLTAGGIGGQEQTQTPLSIDEVKGIQPKVTRKQSVLCSSDAPRLVSEDSIQSFETASFEAPPPLFAEGGTLWGSTFNCNQTAARLEQSRSTTVEDRRIHS